MSLKAKMELMFKNPVISWHEHVWTENGDFGTLNTEFADQQLEIMDMLGVDRIVVSCPVMDDKYCSPEKFIKANDTVRLAIKRGHGRVFGQAFINPGYPEVALSELERCVKDFGFVGAKVYHQYLVDDPVFYPVVEKCIELNVPLTIHQGKGTTPPSGNINPRLSNGVHIANIAKRYPEATFLMGHIGGGGDWQWAIKAVADCPNVFADIGGSVYDRSLVEESVRYLGAERLLFGTDGSWSSGVGKILGAGITDEEKKIILSGKRLEKFLRRDFEC